MGVTVTTDFKGGNTTITDTRHYGDAGAISDGTTIESLSNYRGIINKDNPTPAETTILAESVVDIWKVQVNRTNQSTCSVALTDVADHGDGTPDAVMKIYNLKGGGNAGSSTTNQVSTQSVGGDTPWYDSDPETLEGANWTRDYYGDYFVYIRAYQGGTSSGDYVITFRPIAL